jgi:hypothetical protein
MSLTRLSSTAAVLSVAISLTACQKFAANVENIESRERTLKMPIEQSVLVRRALEVSGFGAQPDIITSVSEVPRPGKLVPFVPAEPSIWKVRIENVRLTISAQGQTTTNPHIRSADLFYSPKADQFIKIVSVPLTGVDLRTFPAVQSEESQMKQIGQIFVGIPEAKPQITFAEALQQTVGVVGARQVIGYYVLESYSDWKRAPRPVWVINAWGIPAFPPIGGTERDVPEAARNHLRTTVDAETGETHGSDTIPQPEPN